MNNKLNATMFTLKKHYFDCIDPQGRVLIAYAAALSVWGVKVPYASVIWQDETMHTQERAGLKAAQLGADGRSFHQAALAIQGEWQPLAAAYKAVDLLATAGFAAEGKQVNWHCHTPHAQADYVWQGKTYHGLGYAETLTLTLEPWRLPLDTLYWGRFLSSSYSLVWLEWRGAYPMRLLYINGRVYRDFVLDKDALCLPQVGIRLVFTQPMVLKDEPLLALAERFTVLNKWFSQDFLNTREMKWKSEAVLSLPDGRQETGWALYEKVIWQGDKK